MTFYVSSFYFYCFSVFFIFVLFFQLLLLLSNVNNTLWQMFAWHFCFESILFLYDQYYKCLPFVFISVYYFEKNKNFLYKSGHCFTLWYTFLCISYRLTFDNFLFQFWKNKIVKQFSTSNWNSVTAVSPETDNVRCNM